MNSTIHIESLFPAQSFLFADWLHAFSNFQLVACWVHGKCKDSILSKISSSVGLKNGLHQSLWSYKLVCWYTALLGTWYFTDARHMLWFWITRHINKTVLLGTWSLDHSALDVTRHLNSDSLGTWTLLFTRHLNTLFTRHLTSLGTWSYWITSALE